MFVDDGRGIYMDSKARPLIFKVIHRYVASKESITENVEAKITWSNAKNTIVDVLFRVGNKVIFRRDTILPLIPKLYLNMINSFSYITAVTNEKTES